MPELLATPQFKQITTRVTEGFAPCNRCAVRHVCGAPCPAEVYAINGRLDAPAPLCDFYTAQAQYAFRVIAQGRLDDYLWDGWKGWSGGDCGDVVLSQKIRDKNGRGGFETRPYRVRD